MSAIIVRGPMLADLAEQLGIPRDEATMSRIHAAMTSRAANGFAGRVMAARIRDKALARDADDAAREQPEHAGEWESIAGALRCQLSDDGTPDGAR